MPVGLGEEIESSLDAHDGDSEVGQAGEVAQEVSGVRPASAFAAGDVTHVVQTILDAPVPSHQREGEFGGGLLGGQGGQAVNGLVLDLCGVWRFAVRPRCETPPGDGAEGPCRYGR